jgi:hypothetical protein
MPVIHGGRLILDSYTYAGRILTVGAHVSKPDGNITAVLVPLG